MNINNRLKKIESQIVNADSEFCGCYEKHWESAIESMYNDNPGVEVEIYPPPDFEKDFCDKCKKPFSSKDIEMSKKLVEIYGDKE